MNMVSKCGLAAGLGLALLTAPLAMAQDDQHHDQHGPQAPQAPAAHPPAAPGRGAAPAEHGGAFAERGAPPAAHGPMENRGPAPGRPPMQARGGGHDWHQGGRYTGGRNVVDYNRYHLRRPPHGYEWVRDNNQFVLIAISSGIIASVLAANGY